MWFTNKKIKVAVHDGNFHADDVFAVAALSIYLNNKIEIIRTRDLKQLEKIDYVLDVGRVYDPILKRFDHHQDGLVRESGAPYASFGLIWKEFGEKIAGSKDAQKMIDEKIVQPIDAIDNAVDLNGKLFNGIKDYSVSDYIIDHNASCQNEKERNKVFSDLVLFGREIINMQIVLTSRILKSKERIILAYKQATNKKVIILNEELEGWNEILVDYPEPLLVIRPMTERNLWKISCVKIKGEKFKNRLNLPASWAGKIEGELVKATGLADALYCHHQRYMAIMKTREGAVKLAELALKEVENNK